MTEEEKPFMHEYDRRQYFIRHFEEKNYGRSHIETMYNDVYDEDEKTEIAESYLSAHPPEPKQINTKNPILPCPECGEDLTSQLSEILEGKIEEIKCPKCGLEISLNK